MASKEKSNKYLTRPLAARILVWILIFALAASVCAAGVLMIILKGPYQSYRTEFVKRICTETRAGFAVRLIIGSEEVDAILGEGVDE